MLNSLENAQIYSFDSEAIMNRMRRKPTMVGMSFSFDAKTGFYVPLGHSNQIMHNSQLPLGLVMDRLKPLMEDPSKTCIMHNAKFDMKVLDVFGGIKLQNRPELFSSDEHRSPIFDTMIAAWLLNTEGEFGLKALAAKRLRSIMTKLEEITPTEKDPITDDVVYRPDLVDIDRLGTYAIDDAVRTFQLKNLFEDELKQAGLDKVFYELEMPFVFVLMNLERAGILIDKEKIESMYSGAPAMLEQIKERIYALRPSGEPFNIASSIQLNQVLFNEMKIKPIGTRGKSGTYSTKEQNMEVWSHQHEICKLILDHRKLYKLIGTYLEGLQKRIDIDGRIRSDFNRFLSTGRLSSSRPNLQNIPRKENDQFNIRSFFIAPAGKVLIDVDYSQVELRVLAHFSKDKNLVQAYRNGEDVHSATAKGLFNLTCPVEEVKKKHDDLRTIAKSCNFAMVYEAGIKQLSITTGVDEDKVKKLKDKYFAFFSGIEKFQAKMHQKAERDGYVKTLIGRYRHLSDAKLAGRTQEENAKKFSAFRKASNSPIQGSAADIIAIAMRNLTWLFQEKGYTDDDIRIVLQVHDELIFEVREELVPVVKPMIEYEMANAVKLIVPLVAEGNVGNNWAEAK